MLRKKTGVTVDIFVLEVSFKIKALSMILKIKQNKKRIKKMCSASINKSGKKLGSCQSTMRKELGNDIHNR